MEWPKCHRIGLQSRESVCIVAHHWLNVLSVVRCFMPNERVTRYVGTDAEQGNAED